MLISLETPIIPFMRAASNIQSFYILLCLRAAFTFITHDQRTAAHLHINVSAGCGQPNGTLTGTLIEYARNAANAYITWLYRFPKRISTTEGT